MAVDQQQNRNAADVRAGSGEMFDRIASRYDLLNRVMSFGLDQRWRRHLVRALACRGGDHILDVASGTADVAIALCGKFGKVRVTGVDPSGRMLAIGQEKVRVAGFADRVKLVEGDAQALPFADHSFDGSCVAFGIRNFPDRRQGLREMLRVTKPGRRVAILELTEPSDGFLRPLTRFHVTRIVPRLGAFLSGDKEYRYLAKSVAEFPAADAFAELMREAGLRNVRYERLSFGAVYLYSGDV